MRRRVAILGAGGSIGSQALDVLARHADRFEVVALAGGRASDAIDAARTAHPSASVLLGGSSPQLAELVSASRPDIVVVASTGLVALEATMVALAGGAAVAIANKETIVAGGDLVVRAAARAAEHAGSSLLERLRPVDSEHSALWQCLAGEEARSVARLWLTASGGPFRTWSADRIAAARPGDALAHPTWSMGAKITIDSASLVNKGLEAIEAHRLFALPMERVGIVVHPQSAIHGLVEFADGSTKAQIGAPDMRGPIAYALGYPERMDSGVAPLDLAAAGSFSFEAPDPLRFPGLQLALEAGRRGGSAPGTLIAADDVAVARFLGGEMRFGGIPALIDESLSRFGGDPAPGSVDEVLRLDAEVRTFARAWAPPSGLAAEER